MRIQTKIAVLLVLFLFLAWSGLPGKANAICGIGVCGNGLLDPGEQCDDGNTDPGDGCSPACVETFDMVAGPTLFNYPGEHPTFVIVADFNQDGIKDWALTTARPSYLYTYLRNASGNSAQVGRYYLGGVDPRGGNGLFMATGDLNGDHFPDLAVAERDDGRVFIFYGKGDGTMNLATTVPAPLARCVSIGNINSDGFDDLIVSRSDTNTFKILYGDGHGAFPVSQDIYAGSALSSWISDLNGDGYSDVLFTSDQPGPGLPNVLETLIYSGSAAGLFFDRGVPGGVANVVSIDLNDDGYPDILSKGADSLPLISTILRTHLNQKDGNFALNWSLDTGLEGYYWVKVDLNNDGRMDIPIGVRTNFAPIYLNQGNGGFAPEIRIPIPAQANQFGPIDYNNDGTTDLIVGSFPISQSFLILNHNYYQFPRCGDGRIGRGENCDDGNRQNGDGCSEVCRRENNYDRDHDGLADYEEADLGTDPLNPDSDGDCSPDGDEYCAGGNPLDPSDQPGCARILTPGGDWHLLATLTGAPDDQEINVLLTSPRREPLIKNSLKNIGKVAQTPVKDGDIVTLSILVGGKYEYSSDSVFARVQMIDAYNYRVGFETLPLEQANWDFQDLTLLLEFVPKTPAVGTYVSSLGEFQNTRIVSATTDTLVPLPFDGNAELTLPAGALDPDTGAVLTAGLDNLYQGLKRDFIVGGFRKVRATNGQTKLYAPATLTISYNDADGDGMVDGSPFFEDELSIFIYSQDEGQWQRLESTVDSDNDRVSAKISMFSIFAIGGSIPTRPDKLGETDDKINHEFFGCSLSASPARGKANAGLALLALLGAALAFRTRARGPARKS